MTIRIAVGGGRQAHSRTILHNAQALGVAGLTSCRILAIYHLAENPGTESLTRLCAWLLADPVTESAHWLELSQEQPATPEGVQVIEVALRPGVTDVTARELRRGMAELGMPACAVATATRYELAGTLNQAALHQLARQLLCNDTIEEYRLGPLPPHFGQEAAALATVEQVALAGLDDASLLALSRRRVLALDLAEMHAIQQQFALWNRPPTDVELETLAQTWSEHCVHKTFRAEIEFVWQDAQGGEKQRLTIDGLLNQFIRAATHQADRGWLRSAFVDDAGIIAFDQSYDLAFKVETHNHPSALEPFGGANTGVGGVVRDILGVSARPIATTNMLCFGPQDFPPQQLPAGVLHPRRIAEGVVAGIADYGNKLGLPTVNGAIVYHPGYLGNPLVFCGAVGLLPNGSHPTTPQVDDLIVVLGGRTGRDGLHGATFSSAELTHDTAETVGSAVQIGDPITEKGLIELLVAAREEQLYHAVTDCGAGGLSSAIGEMGESLGVDVELTRAPLKYPGLVPWEIWLSEAQERLVLAVPPPHLRRLQALAELWEVEISQLGRFTGDGRLRVRHGGEVVADLEMDFLHGGLPRRRLQAIWREPAPPTLPPPQPLDLNATLLALLSDPSVASKEEVIRRYDHEVQGGTLVRPLTGPQMDGPSDGAVLKPLDTWHHNRAFSLSMGVNPTLGQLDPYAMAVSAVDEAIRNGVAVGADPDHIALLDNFCWGNPAYPDRLGALVRACQGCYDGAVAYRAPYISGKDSLNNEFNGSPIPGTLLISAIGLVPDMTRCPTAHLKQPGNLLYLLGSTRAELGGSLLYAHLGYPGGQPPMLPPNALECYRALHQAIRQGLVCSCHDLSEGGLAVALAEMALAGRLGLQVTLVAAPGSGDPASGVGPNALGRESESADQPAPTSGLHEVEQLFSESNGRLLIEVRPADAPALESLLAGHALRRVAIVEAEPRLRVQMAGQLLIDLPVAELVRAWKREDAAGLQQFA